MTITISLSPQNEERLVEAARRIGIEPSDFAQQLVENNLPPAMNNDNDIGDFGGLSIADLAGDLIGSVSGDYTDMAHARRDAI